MERETDDMMVERGMQNSRAHLSAGVTTVRDCGARNNVARRLRDLSTAQLFDCPRVLVCGAPITPSRGHFWFCNGEADGPDGVRRRARALLNEGVDFLKVMASGGGTAGTDSRRAAYRADEIAVAVEEAHRVTKRVVAHCLSAESIDVALEAGWTASSTSISSTRWIARNERCDCPSYCGSRSLRHAHAADGFRRLDLLRTLEAPTADEVREMGELELKVSTKLEFVRRLHGLGAKIVAATDAVDDFGDYALGLELLVDAGMTPAEAIGAGTQRAAEAIGLGDSIGALSAGRIADLIVVAGEATVDLSGLRRPRLVMRAGRIVSDPAEVNESK